MTTVCLTLCYSSTQLSLFARKPVDNNQCHHIFRAFIAQVSVRVPHSCLRSPVCEWERQCTLSHPWASAVTSVRLALSLAPHTYLRMMLTYIYVCMYRCFFFEDDSVSLLNCTRFTETRVRLTVSCLLPTEIFRFGAICCRRCRKACSEASAPWGL